MSEDPWERKAVQAKQVAEHLRSGWELAPLERGWLSGDLDLYAMRRLKAATAKPLWMDDVS